MNVLVFGDPDGDHIRFGPLRKNDEYFVHSPISVVVAGRVIELGERNGIEHAALDILRRDLEQLRRHRRGCMYFGDHDFGQLVNLEAGADGSVVHVSLDLPMQDMWDVEMPAMPFERLDRLIAVVDAMEREVGPLLGWCCGEPQPTWRDSGSTQS